jgi:hypothetical protein
LRAAAAAAAQMFLCRLVKCILLPLSWLLYRLMYLVMLARILRYLLYTINLQSKKERRRKSRLHFYFLDEQSQDISNTSILVINTNAIVVYCHCWYSSRVSSCSRARSFSHTPTLLPSQTCLCVGVDGVGIDGMPLLPSASCSKTAARSAGFKPSIPWRALSTRGEKIGLFSRRLLTDLTEGDSRSLLAYAVLELGGVLG